MRKYLKNIEDIEALRNTDTKIFFECEHGAKEEYYQFVNGVICRFWKGKLAGYNVLVDFEHRRNYIEVEEEPSEDYIGILGYFWDFGETDDGFIDVLDEIDVRAVGCDKYFPKYASSSYQHFRPLTPKEVEKYTGYSVIAKREEV